MRISRAPFRVSLFGGGTDFKSWYSLHGATIIAFSIDRYCYVSLRSLLPFYGNKYRIAWSSIETPMSIDEIKHPSIRKCLLFKGLTDGLEIHTDGDLPARSGLGSSSSFTVAFLHACNAFSSTNASVNALAREAIYVEQEILSESVGIQDQIQACYGGFNVMKINQDGKYSIFSL
jgi:D-glycero-alpha-D-manno-heptose-7-phosphate kinase